jgi:hypothetical protein
MLVVRRKYVLRVLKSASLTNRSYLRFWFKEVGPFSMSDRGIKRNLQRVRVSSLKILPAIPDDVSSPLWQ